MRRSVLVFILLLGSLVEAKEGFRPPVEPITDADFFYDGAPETNKVELGRLLYFDPLISGNRNISCATCHHPLLGTADGLSLPIGEGGHGLGMARTFGEGGEAVEGRIPRHSPALFNSGAKEIHNFFWDARLFLPEKFAYRNLVTVFDFFKGRSGIASPVSRAMPAGLDNILAAQAMMPVVSLSEMAGSKFDNEVGAFAYTDQILGRVGAWRNVIKRVHDIPEYVERFMDVFPELQRKESIEYFHAANAIAAFETVAFRSDQSPFDQYVRGELEALNDEAMRGMELFYGKANCATCHSGKFFTDQKVHGLALPNLGPGKGHGALGLADFGHWEVTRLDIHMFQFRTPALRNVEKTAPYGHNGAYSSLEGIVRHHLNPEPALRSYDASQLMMPKNDFFDTKDMKLLEDEAAIQDVLKHQTIESVELSDREVADVVSFLKALTDPMVEGLSDLIPASVPSGLALDKFEEPVK